MFKTVLGKKCLENPACKLTGQMQDAGLPLCPECACELTPVTRVVKGAVLAAALIAMLLLSASSVLAYARVVQGFTTQQTMQWVTGHLKRVDRLGVRSDEWLTGTLSWWTPGGSVKERSSKYLLYERVNNRHYFRPDFTSEHDDRLRFELSPRTEFAYVIYRAPDRPMLLFPDKNRNGAVSGRLMVPPDPKQAIRLSGPSATEHFVFIASKKNVPELEAFGQTQNEPNGSQLDEVIHALEQDTQNAAVYHVMIPHK